MKVDILTIFPEMFDGVFSHSLLQKAGEKGLCKINIHDLRDYTEDKHKKVDDSSFGGGPGMVFKPEPLGHALKDLKKENTTVILTCPQGEPYTQQLAQELSKKKHLIIIAGHYEGIDYRITDTLVDKSISIGDYVLCGGEVPSMVITEAAIRLLPGVVGNADSITFDSFQDGLLDYPHFTRPSNYLGQNPPSVLLSGSHKDIDHWRRQQSLTRTFDKRPDLFASVELKKEDRALFTEYLKSEKVLEK